MDPREAARQAEEDVFRLHETSVRRTYLDGRLVHGAEAELADQPNDELPDERVSLF